MKVAFNGISEERERRECLPRRVRRAFRVRPPDREREIRTTRNPKQAPTSLSLSLSASATRESKMGRRIEINAPMTKSALARLRLFSLRQRSRHSCAKLYPRRKAPSLSFKQICHSLAADLCSVVFVARKSRNEFVSDLAMMCTMMRARLLRSPFSLSLFLD